MVALSLLTTGYGAWGFDVVVLLLPVVLAAAWLDTLTEAHGDLLVVARVALAMGKERELPAWLGAVHKRFHSPHHAVIALGVLCSSLALFLDLRTVLEPQDVFLEEATGGSFN